MSKQRLELYGDIATLCGIVFIFSIVVIVGMLAESAPNP